LKPPSLRELLAELGWTAHERDDGRLLIDLEIPWGFAQATIEGTHETGARVFAEICDCRATRSTAEAIAEFLSGVAGSILPARGIAREENAHCRTIFEVRLPPELSSDELAGALHAVSGACAAFGREIRALEDDDLAREYLAARENRKLTQAPRRAGGSHGK
jgi:hypothetical protein